jgi:glycosyltransferase involved in cell wall biosynthesis
VREASSEIGNRQVQGLAGSLDLPGPGEVLRRQRTVVGGWVTHRRRKVLGVLVAVNGEVMGGCHLDVPRPDVGERYPDRPGSSMAGFTLEVDLHDVVGDEVELVLHVVLGPKPGESEAEAGVSVPFLSRTFSLSDVGDGRFVEEDDVPHGPTRIQGLAEAPGGVSSVEVFLDGESVGLARTGLPGRLSTLDEGIGGSIALFETSLVVPADREMVTFTARVTPCTGPTFDLEPWTAAVRPDEQEKVTAERMTLVRERTLAAVSALRPDHAADPSGPLRVLVVTHDLGLGGGQLYLQELLKRLVARGLECVVITPRGGRLTTELEDLGIPVLVTGAVDIHDPEAYEAQVAQVMEYSVRHGCEVALANTMTAYAGVDAAQRLGLGVVWAIHESWPFMQFWGEAVPPPFPAYAAEHARGALATASRVVFEAAATRDIYVPLLGEGRAVVVPYGVDFGEIEEYRRRHDRDRAREELGLDPDTVVLLCIGTVEPRKAQVNIAQAFATSAGLRGRDVTLVFVGAKKGAPYSEHLTNVVEEYGDARVRIEPIQPDTYRWYQACDVLLCGSDVESLPRTMLEAMAFERAVASTAVFGIPELVDDGVDGFLCRARDQLAMRTMLERVVDTSREELAAMGVRARRKVLERHDPEIYTRYYFDELHDVAGRRAT